MSWVWVDLINQKNAKITKVRRFQEETWRRNITESWEVGPARTKQNEDAWSQRCFRGDRRMMFINCSHGLSTAETQCPKTMRTITKWWPKSPECPVLQHLISEEGPFQTQWRMGKWQEAKHRNSYMSHKILLNELEAIQI